MRRIVLSILRVGFLPTFAYADPFADFRIPDHVIRTGAVDVSGAGSWSAETWSEEQRSSSMRSALRLSLGWTRDSDALQYGADLFRAP